MSEKKSEPPSPYSEVRGDVEKALADIKGILQNENGPVTVEELRRQMPSSTKTYFDEARKFGERNYELYVHQKGIVDSTFVENLSLEERIAHIKWSLGLHEVSAKQYLQDKPVLLQVPSLLKRLKEKHDMDFPRWRDEVLNVISEAQNMRNTLDELSVAYGQIAAATRKLIGSPKDWSKIGNDLSDLKKLKKEFENIPHCKHCGSFDVRPIGKHKDMVKCYVCERVS